MLLPCFECGVEVCFLLGCEVECDVVTFFEDVVEVLVFFAEGLEVFFKCFVAGVCEDVVPYELCVQVVEGKAGKESVFCIADQVQDLAWGSGE